MPDSIFKVSKTDYAAELTLNYFFRGTAPPSLPEIYIGLLKQDPGPSGAAVEPTEAGSGYERIAGEFNDPIANTDFGRGQISELLSDVDFPKAQTDWGVITHVGFFTSKTGDYMTHYAELPAAREVKIGDYMTFEAGNIVAREY